MSILIGVGCSVEPAGSSGFATAGHGPGTSGTSVGNDDTGVDDTRGPNDGPETDSGAATEGDPTGSDPTGGDPTGSDPTGSDPTGDDPTGDDPTGDDPTGDDPTGGDPGPVCGDGMLDRGEDCDTDVARESCQGLGFDGGTLACAADCTWETSACHLCGDDVIGGPEVCDGTDLANTDCTDLPGPNGNYTGGTLGCEADCSAFDDTDCTWCGDGIKNGNEACDGEDLDGATCVDAGWLAGGEGEVSCTRACELYDTLCTGMKCGETLEAPGDGEGSCTAPWTDTGSACQRTCQSGGGACPGSVDCPADRACSVSCSGLSACSGTTIGCAEGHPCDVACTSSSSCSSGTILCPPDAPCSVTCSALSACNGLTIVCPAGNHACELTCSSSSGCANVEMQCGQGPCTMSCSNNLNVCNGAQMQCGINACEATCGGNSAPSLECGESCNCAPC
jgi:hypothetical protein